MTERYLIPTEGAEKEPLKTALSIIFHLTKKFHTDIILLVPNKINLQSTTIGSVLGDANEA